MVGAVRMDAVAGIPPCCRTIQGYADIITLNSIMRCALIPQPYSKVAIAADQVALTQRPSANTPVATDDVVACTAAQGNPCVRKANDLQTADDIVAG